MGRLGSQGPAHGTASGPAERCCPQVLHPPPSLGRDHHYTGSFMPLPPGCGVGVTGSFPPLPACHTGVEGTLGRVLFAAVFREGVLMVGSCR